MLGQRGSLSLHTCHYIKRSFLSTQVMDTGLYMNPEYPVVLSRSPLFPLFFLGTLGFVRTKIPC